MKAMILAAGCGRRMMPLTQLTPKPLLKVGELTLIERIILQLKRAGITEIVINVCYMAESIIDHLGEGERYGLNIVYSKEEAGLLGTGGGIFQALPLLGQQPFLLVSADIYTDFPFVSLLTRQLRLAHLVMVDNPEFLPQGDFALRQGQLFLTGETLTYANIALIDPKLFMGQPPGCYPLSPLFTAGITQGKISGEHYAGSWSNVGTPELLADINASTQLNVESSID